MDSSLPNASEAGRGARHGWNSLDDYRWQHLRRLDNYSGFVAENFKSSFEEVPSDTPGLSYLRISMEIPCEGGIKLTVDKLAEIKKVGNRRLARTIRYVYNASLPDRPILRYDNAHIYPGHVTKHHRHVFNGTGREVPESPFDVGEDGWPHMHEVIEELMNRFAVSN